MRVEQIVDASIALTSLPARVVAIEDYARDLDDSEPVAVCKGLAVKFALMNDPEGCLLALQEAERLILRFGKAA